MDNDVPQRKAGVGVRELVIEGDLKDSIVKAYSKMKETGEVILYDIGNGEKVLLLPSYKDKRATEKEAGDAKVLYHLIRGVFSRLDARSEAKECSIFDRRRDFQEFVDEDEPIKCEKCGNVEEWIVYIHELRIYIDKTGRIVLKVEEDERLWKPDTIIWICANCKIICLESLIY